MLVSGREFLVVAEMLHQGEQGIDAVSVCAAMDGACSSAPVIIVVIERLYCVQVHVCASWACLEILVRGFDVSLGDGWRLCVCYLVHYHIQQILSAASVVTVMHGR